MVTAFDVACFLDSLFPKETAESFDNVGLLVGSKNQPVKKIMVMLDADKDTIKEAIDQNVDMIITHHPFIFSPLKAVCDELILSLIKNNISLYSAHTNLDSGVMGVNDNLAKILELENATRVTMPECNLVGITGDTKEQTLGEFISFVKAKLEIDNLRYTGDINKIVKKVGVIGGSAAEFISKMKHLGCDTFVTADLKYHQAQLADQIEINIIDAGHFETENHIIKVVGELLKKQFSDTEVSLSERKNSYIKYG